jgi:adhesin/invasin
MSRSVPAAVCSIDGPPVLVYHDADLRTGSPSQIGSYQARQPAAPGHKMTQKSRAIRRGRATRRSHTARVGAALSTGIVGAAMLAGGAPVALASTRTPASVAAVSGGAAPVRTEAATGMGEECFPLYGTCKTITETLNPPSIAANGTSTSIATATVQLCNTALTTCSPDVQPAQTVVFTSTDPGETISATTMHPNGVFTAVITSSTTAGQATITATDSYPDFPSGNPTSIHATAILTQTPGPGVQLVLVVSPSSIVANGKSTSTATATVRDGHGNTVAGDTVSFTSSDKAEKISTTTDHSNGTYTVTITSSKTTEVATITATDTTETPNLKGSAPLRQTPVTPTVPATGASDELQLTGGAGLLALGAGLLAGIAGWRRRIRRAPG